jgi:transposase-like protein
MVLWKWRGELGMGKRGHSEEEILRVLREAESGETVVEICRKHGMALHLNVIFTPEV